MKNIIELMNKSMEDKLNESLTLKNNVPYMMRNDGEVFEVIYSISGPIDHPYVVDRVRRGESDFIIDSLYDREKCFKWFFDHTNSRALRKYIQNYYLALIEVNFEDIINKNPILQQLTKDFNLTSNIDPIPTIDLDLEGAKLALTIIEDSTNQEFLKFRFQSEFNGLNMFCRISSKDFNWYDNLCNFLFNHSRQISTITITTDSLAGMENRIKSYKGQDFIMMSINDFLTLNGRPLVEGFNKIQEIFNENLRKRYNFCEFDKGKLLADLGEFSNSRIIKDIPLILNESIINVKSDTPYMLRLNGEAIQIDYPDTQIVDHPYILEYETNKVSKDDILESLKPYKLRCWEWFFNSTKSYGLKEAIQNYFKCIIANSNELNLDVKAIDDITERFNLNPSSSNKDPFMNGSLQYCLDQLPIINFDTNQEFLRFRAQTEGYGKNMLMFRISSKGVDWYDAICKFLIDNYVQIGHIIISYDQQAGRGAETLKYRGQSLSFVTVEEFLNLKGTPIIESFYTLTKALKNNNVYTTLKLNEGLLLHDSCKYCNPHSIQRLIERINSLGDE